MTSREAESVVRIALACVGMTDANVKWHPENLTGADDKRCDGLVRIGDNVDVYPALVGTEIGWGVCRAVCKPGRWRMPNGDPGWPDDWDYEDVAEPSVTVNSITGKRVRPRPVGDAVCLAVSTLVRERLAEWMDEWMREPTDEGAMKS